MGSLTLRPGDSLTIPKMAWSVGFLRFVSSTEATQATGVLTVPPVGLLPLSRPALAGRTHPQSSVLAGILSCRGFESRTCGLG